MWFSVFLLLVSVSVMFSPSVCKDAMTCSGAGYWENTSLDDTSMNFLPYAPYTFKKIPGHF